MNAKVRYRQRRRRNGALKKDPISLHWSAWLGEYVLVKDSDYETKPSKLWQAINPIAQRVGNK